jgi:PPM family protein phosphatase
VGGEQATMQVHATSDVGLRRTHNEDHFAIWPEDPAERGTGVLLAIADGMGGAVAGEVASHIAVDTALALWRERGGQGDAGTLREALEAANRAVHAESVARTDRRGMGTTLTLVALRDDHGWFAHVGDSRLYLVRHGEILQLTEDHSLVAQLVRERQMTPEQARVDPRRNVVTRSVGVNEQVDVDVSPLPALQPGDTLVLSTDGLHGLVEDHEIAPIVSGSDLSAACQVLVALARERGGPDNITVMLARA